MATIENSFEIKLSGLRLWAKANDSNMMSVFWKDEVVKCELRPDFLIVLHQEKVWSVPIFKYIWFKGRERSLLQCPHACERNCASLYLVNCELGCRKCSQLIHESNSGHLAERLNAKRTKILTKLKTLPGAMPVRPANMKRSYYLALLKELEFVGLQ